MSFADFIIRIIIAALIIVALTLLGRFVGYLIINRKGKVNIPRHNKHTQDRGIVQHHVFVKIIAWINLIFGSYMFIAPVVTYMGIFQLGKGVNLPVVIFGTGYFLFTVIFFLYSVVWKIEWLYYEITYRNALGIKKKYDFREIEIVRENLQKVIVYKDGNRIFSIDMNPFTVNCEEFYSRGLSHGAVKGINKKSKKNRRIVLCQHGIQEVYEAQH